MIYPLSKKKKMIKKIAIVIILIFNTLCIHALKPRVVGYIMNDNEFDQKFSELRWDWLTHLNVAFIQVCSNGELKDDGVKQHLPEIVETAHRNNVKVLISLQSDGDGFYKAIKNPQIRKKLGQSIIDYVKVNKLDGFDLDYELYDHICPELVLFAKEIHKAKERKMLQTCAVPCFNPTEEGGYTDKWQKYFDFVNMMAYDATGPWAQEGPHAPFQQVVDGVKIWTRTLKVPHKRLVVGLPFYGWSWDKENVTSLTYDQIISEYTGKITPDDDIVGRTYFNGETTIRKKCRYVIENKLGGVMIWQLFHDAKNKDKKLLKAINEELFK